MQITMRETNTRTNDHIGFSLLTRFIKTRQVSNAGSNLPHGSLDLPHDLLITLLPRHPEKIKIDVVKTKFKKSDHDFKFKN